MSAIVELIKAFIKSSNHTAESYKEFKTNLERLINTGQNVNEPDKYNRSALHHAAIYGDVKLVDMLLDNGANIDLQDNYCRTPLWIAAYKGHVDVVARLIKSGAKYIELYRSIAEHSVLFPSAQDMLKNIATYASRQENKILACFVPASTASQAIAAFGVLAVCGIMSCSWVIYLAFAIVSCLSSLVFLHLLDKQNTQRQEIISESNEDKSVIGQTDKTSRQKWLLTACAVLQVSAVVSAAFCPPLCLAVIGILSSSLLSISISEMPKNHAVSAM
jgi:ankyrin repeat protein